MSGSSETHRAPISSSASVAGLGEIPDSLRRLAGLFLIQIDDGLEQVDAACREHGLFLTQPPEAFSNIGTGRSLFFPRGIPAGRSVFVAASRLGTQLDTKPGFFDALRTLACRINPEEEFLITAARVSADRFVKRTGELFTIPVCKFQPLPENIDNQWLNKVSQPAAGLTCFYSEIRNPANTDDGGIDNLLIQLAHQVRIISVRAGGKTMAAIRTRLDNGFSNTRLLIDSDLTKKATRQQLLEAGATAWWLFRDPEREPCKSREPGNADKPGQFDRARQSSPGKSTRSIARAPLLSIDEIDQSRFLAHWTRRRVGPWPDQTENEYLDDLIFGATRAQHDPLAALCRILACQQIIASNDLTRDSTRVVCSSGVPLDQILTHRKFRPHLSRWDFEPFGIAFDKEVLIKLGTRKVIYGDDQLFESLSEFDRAFFQLQTGESGIDWTEEQEWRTTGDIDLKQIGPTDAIVFVPDADSAEIVARLSRWPVLVLDRAQSGS